MFEKLLTRHFEFAFASHAKAILSVDFPEAVKELAAVLEGMSIPIEEIISSGGGEAKGTQRLRHALSDLGWVKQKFEIKKVINGIEKESISHEVDHVRTFADGSRIALEIEWNNKDPFFDRDLENFKRLHAEGAISVGVIITRGSALQENLRELVRKFVDVHEIDSFEDLAEYGVVQTARQRAAVQRQVDREENPMDFRTAWTRHFVSDKFGAATTHWRKLEDRIVRGVGNPCPLLLIGLPPAIIVV